MKCMETSKAASVQEIETSRNELAGLLKTHQEMIQSHQMAMQQLVIR